MWNRLRTGQFYRKEKKKRTGKKAAAVIAAALLCAAGVTGMSGTAPEVFGAEQTASAKTEKVSLTGASAAEQTASAKTAEGSRTDTSAADGQEPSLTGADGTSEDADSDDDLFTLGDDTNTAGLKGQWKDIAPEGAVKGTNRYQIRVVWGENAGSAASRPVITWTSSDESVASVDADGTVTGHKEGHADVTAAAGSCVRKFGINVKIPADEPYTVSDGVLRYTSENLGEKYRLTVSLPSDGTISWEGQVSGGTEGIVTVKNSSGGEDLYLPGGKACTFRTVPESGRTSRFALTPSSAGSVRARADDTSLAVVTLNAPASLTVSTVPTVYATGIKAPADFVMKVGETVTLSPEITPSDVTVVPTWKYREQSDYWKNFIPGTTGFANAVQFDGYTVTAVRKGTADFAVSISTGENTEVTDSLRITVVDQNTHLFDDVRSTESYYYKPVYWAEEEQITSGTTETTFSPDATVTRGQIAMFLWKAAGSPEPDAAGRTGTSSGSSQAAADTLPFTDVPKTSPFYKAIYWAWRQGITSGITDTEFGIARPCTRAQIVTFLYKYKDSPGVDKNQVREKFEDVSAGSYYEDAVYYAAAYGITSGVSKNAFGPDRTCTRGQAVTFLYRAEN